MNIIQYNHAINVLGTQIDLYLLINLGISCTYQAATVSKQIINIIFLQLIPESAMYKL